MDTITEDLEEHLITHDYVVVETCALLHRRMGIGPVRVFIDSILPACEVRIVDRALYERSLGAYLASSAKGGSLVDQVSFELMRRDAIDQAFTFDRDFADEGFAVVPEVRG
jgi:predicted nucleic acid-binding protein